MFPLPIYGQPFPSHMAGLTDQGVATQLANIFARLSRNDPSLLSVNLNGLPPDIKYLRNLCRALAQNTTLTQLHLQGWQLGDSLFEELVLALENNFNLSVLDLSQNGISDLAANTLAFLLFRHPRLEELNLRGNQLGDSGAWMLASRLSDVPALAWLNLQDNKIGERGVRTLLATLNRNPGLCHCEVDYPDPSVDGMPVGLGIPVQAAISQQMNLPVEEERQLCVRMLAQEKALHLSVKRYLTKLQMEYDQAFEGGVAIEETKDHIAGWRKSLGIVELRWEILDQLKRRLDADAEYARLGGSGKKVIVSFSASEYDPPTRSRLVCRNTLVVHQAQLDRHCACFGYKDFLQEIKGLIDSRYSCYICPVRYRWRLAADASLHQFLIRLQFDLQLLGVPVYMDAADTRGTIERNDMISRSRRILLVGTPKVFRYWSGESVSMLPDEREQVCRRMEQNPETVNFCTFSGERKDDWVMPDFSLPENCFDFRDLEEYPLRMVDIFQPHSGLIAQFLDQNDPSVMARYTAALRKHLARLS
ncbi:hypothetical protein FNU76_11315 [Chitinimonas arctica]|uniref:Uncharacterized protein n=1 Tax=Chitinimonas arctica TaxID=2594795 RepID=A0A516SFG2_9NEIS|nr:hypothetical protein [Chitinimonas arctica]QDQ26901.1 hypothetical protein FNU76_11315 [Chitinimonas arctica]